MRTLNGVGIGVFFIIVMALAGCSAPPLESRREEYQDRAEEIYAGMLKHVPVNDAFDVGMTSQPQFGETKLLVGPEHDTAFWTIWSAVEVSTDVTPAQAADVAGEFLLDQRWTVEPTVDQGGTMEFATVYRLAEPDGEWIVQISWPGNNDDHRISVSVQSPLTVRGAMSSQG
ncbi:hypothetical protein [Paeniglutamicibacter terrestris]|uniref:DUF4440 domain-containing protein n=1 Tax=Paeniglutamicibacter terrestris TaxID=2723403 RepID=A0ABX1G195_9MICC|nr:hypothetical protein [Paeniglutamicibacter terrestris]NKG19440.1 hypothetical protein [Paeniglutamicibacter terrestris]